MVDRLGERKVEYLKMYKTGVEREWWVALITYYKLPFLLFFKRVRLLSSSTINKRKKY
jgi:hypothetical protein